MINFSDYSKFAADGYSGNISEEYSEPVGKYNPALQEVYDEFTEFFQNPTMIKTKEVEGHSVYMTKTHCLLSRECRFLVALVKSDGMSLGTPEELKNLPWVSFQTRTLKDAHKELQPHIFYPKAKGKMLSILTRTNSDTESSTYSCEELPIIVTMLHKKKEVDEYSPSGSLASALQTYYTVISFEA